MISTDSRITLQNRGVVGEGAGAHLLGLPAARASYILAALPARPQAPREGKSAAMASSSSAVGQAQTGTDTQRATRGARPGPSRRPGTCPTCQKLAARALGSYYLESEAWGFNARGSRNFGDCIYLGCACAKQLKALLGRDDLRLGIKG